MAEQYVQAFGNLAKKSNTVILPEKAGDVSSMVAQASPTADLNCAPAIFVFLTSLVLWLVQAMAIYGHMIKHPSPDDPTSPDSGEDGDSSGPDKALFLGLEKNLEDLNKTIEDTIGQKSEYVVPPGDTPATQEEPHFTLGTSPTYKP